MLTKYAETEILSVERADQTTSRVMRLAHKADFSHIERRPGYIYVRSRAISSRINDNFDGFPAEEIKQAYRTFMGKPVFVNHKNSNHRRSRGAIVAVALHEDTNPDGSPDTWAEVLMEVDAIRFPVLAREIEKGNIARTSMGTDVKYSVCTACGNKAYTPVDYCAHIPKMKGMKIHRTLASGQKQAVLVAEICYGLGFFENSLLVEPPADPTAYVLGVESGDMAKAASKVAFPSTRDIADELEGNRGHGQETTQRRQRARPAAEDDGPAIHLHNENMPGFGMGSPERHREFLNEQTRSMEHEHRQLQHQYHPGQPYQRTRDEQKIDKMTSLFTSTPGPAVTALLAEAGWGPNLNDSTLYFGDLAGGYVPLAELDYDGPEGSYFAGVGVGGTGEILWASNHSMSLENAKALAESKAKEFAANGGPTGSAVEALLAEAALKPVVIKASEIREGDRLDISGKTRVVQRHPRTDKVMVKTQTRGARSPSVKHWDLDEDVRVYREGSMDRLAYGETKAPAKVDTLRAEACPVCGDDEAFNGQQCNVCGYAQPPEQFRDPDLNKAKEMDLRQDQQDQQQDPLAPEVPAEAPQAPEEDLQCTNCGEVFSAEGDAATDTNPDPEAEPGTETTAPEADPQHPEDAKDGDRAKADKPDDLNDLADLTDKDLGLDDEEEDDQVSDPKEDPRSPAAPDAKGEGRVTPDGASDPTIDQPGQTDPNVKVDPNAEVDDEPVIAPNMTCPVCGMGTLVPMTVPEDQTDLDEEVDPSNIPPKKVPQNSSRQKA